MVLNQDYCGDYTPERFSTVDVELPNDVIDSVESFARYVPENNLNGAYAWVLREGLKSLDKKIEQGEMPFV